MRASPGIDLVAVQEIREAISSHADRYLDRVFTAQELRDSRDRTGSFDLHRLAQRFAAKEATRKALRVDAEAIPWLAISVRAPTRTPATLELSGAAADLADRRGIEQLELSLARTASHGAAVVIAWEGEHR